MEKTFQEESIAEAKAWKLETVRARRVREIAFLEHKSVAGNEARDEKDAYGRSLMPRLD